MTDLARVAAKPRPRPFTSGADPRDLPGPTALPEFAELPPNSPLRGKARGDRSPTSSTTIPRAGKISARKVA